MCAAVNYNVYVNVNVNVYVNVYLNVYANVYEHVRLPYSSRVSTAVVVDMATKHNVRSQQGSGNYRN